MVDRRLFGILLGAVLLISVLHAERARNDNRQDDEEEEIDSANDNSNVDDVIETFKRFLLSKKATTTSTVKPTSGAISALFTTTGANKVTPTSRFGATRSTAKYGSRTRVTTAPVKDACGSSSICKNGGTCKTLSSGRFYCFCSQDYYGKNCENKFISTGTANNDRARVDHCGKSPCRNGGECVGLRTTYYCRCKSPYYGTICDKRIGKRDAIVDESNSSEQEINAYERDLEEDTEDLRRAIANEDSE